MQSIFITKLRPLLYDQSFSHHPWFLIKFEICNNNNNNNRMPLALHSSVLWGILICYNCYKTWSIESTINVEWYDGALNLGFSSWHFEVTVHNCIIWVIISTSKKRLIHHRISAHHHTTWFKPWFELADVGFELFVLRSSSTITAHFN